jgi:hypothetical protein
MEYILINLPWSFMLSYHDLQLNIDATYGVPVAPRANMTQQAGIITSSLWVPQDSIERITGMCSSLGLCAGGGGMCTATFKGVTLACCCTILGRDATK